MNEMIRKNWETVQKKYLGKKVDVTKVVRELGFKLKDANVEVKFTIVPEDVIGSESCSLNNCAGVRSLYRIYDKRIDWAFIGPKYSYVVWKKSPTVAHRYSVPHRFFVWKAGFDFIAKHGLSQPAKNEMKVILAKEVSNGKADFNLLPPSRSDRYDYKKQKYEEKKLEKKKYRSGPSGKRTKVTFIANAHGSRGKNKSPDSSRMLTMSA